jgi:hypothetical protein
MGLLGFCFYYASHNKAFEIRPAKGLDLMCARFVASMLMHINVEKDVRLGLNMMKYVINHSENFHSVGPPFIMGFLHYVISLTVECNVMLILTSTEDLLNVVMKFVSLTVFVNIPRFYSGSLINHKGVAMCGL